MTPDMYLIGERKRRIKNRFGTTCPAKHWCQQIIKYDVLKSYQDDMQKVQSVSSKKAGRRYGGLNSGSITCKAKAFMTELQSSCLMSGEFTYYLICEKLDQESVQDCLSGETLMLANLKVQCAKSLQRQLYWCKRDVAVWWNQHKLKTGLKITMSDTVSDHRSSVCIELSSDCF